MDSFTHCAEAADKLLLCAEAMAGAYRELQQSADLLQIEVTKRPRAEEGLLQRTVQLDTLFNEAPIGVFLLDNHLRFLKINPAALPVFGNIPDLIGRDFGEIVHLLRPKPDADEIVERFGHTLETSEPYAIPERTEQHGDSGVSEVYEWQVSRIPLPDGNYGVVCYFRDITAHVRIREALRAGEERLQGILRQATVGFAQADLTGRLILANDRFCEILGYPRNELLRRRMQDITHPDDLANSIALFEQAVQTGEDFVTEKRYVRRDGSVVWVHNSVYAVRDAYGRIEAITSISIDISDRKSAEQALDKLNAQLESRIAQQTAELVNTIAQRESLNEQLWHAQRIESIGMLASGVAHDFNNLLNLILGYSSLLEANSGDSSIVANSASAIKDSVKEGASLVKQLLAFGHKADLQFELLDFNRLIQGLDSLLKTALQETIDVSLDLAPGLPPVKADANKMNQVLLNLCVNARDAMPEGGRLRITTRMTFGTDLRERFPEAKTACYLNVRVSDSGTGIDPSIKNRVFEPFFTTKESGKGTGLGLPIVYGIITRHGGFLDITSGPAEGTTVDFYLPLIDPKSEVTAANAA